MLKVKTWLVVADNTSARFLENTGAGTGLHQLSGMLLTAEEKQPFSDDEGRMRGPKRDDSVRPEKHKEREPEVERFARQLSGVLSKAAKQDRFDRLVISASPSMLGILRTMLPATVTQRVRAEYNKNLTHIPTESLGAYFTDDIKI